MTDAQRRTPDGRVTQHLILKGLLWTNAVLATVAGCFVLNGITDPLTPLAALFCAVLAAIFLKWGAE